MGVGLLDSLLKRTNLKAIVDGKEICGCGECSNNATNPGLFSFAPMHQCLLVSEGGRMKVIMDPFNVPEWCPLKK